MKQIVYLGGVGDDDTTASPHLRSRRETGERLSAGAVPVAVATTRDEQVGADAVQDAFAGIVRSWRGIRKRGALEAFAWRAIVNAPRDRRAVRAEASESPELPAPSAAAPDESVRQAIAELPERQRRANGAHHRGREPRSVSTSPDSPLCT